MFSAHEVEDLELFFTFTMSFLCDVNQELKFRVKRKKKEFYLMLLTAADLKVNVSGKRRTQKTGLENR